MLPVITKCLSSPKKNFLFWGKWLVSAWLYVHQWGALPCNSENEDPLLPGTIKTMKYHHIIIHLQNKIMKCSGNILGKMVFELRISLKFNYARLKLEQIKIHVWVRNESKYQRRENRKSLSRYKNKRLFYRGIPNSLGSFLVQW